MYNHVKSFLFLGQTETCNVIYDSCVSVIRCIVYKYSSLEQTKLKDWPDITLDTVLISERYRH